MKDCKKIQPMLSEYIDGVLQETDSSLVRSHLDECAECMEMYQSMRELLVYMNDMEQVDPPAGFVGRVNERLEQESSFRGVIRKIFYPLHVKVPIEIAGLAAAVVLIVYVSGFVGKEGLEEILPVGTGRKEVATLDGEKLESNESQAMDESVEPVISTDSEKKKSEPLTIPEISGTTEEILVEAPVKQIEVRDSDVSYRVSSDELEELPVDDVVEALALKGGIVKTGDDLHVRGGTSSTEQTYMDSSPDSIMAHLSRDVDMIGGRILDFRVIEEKVIDPEEKDADETRVKTARSFSMRALSAGDTSGMESSALSDSLVVQKMRPVVVIIPRSELERMYMLILRIGAVRPVEMEQISEEGDSVRVRIRFPGS